jgi:uncharacterized membrane protein
MMHKMTSIGLSERLESVLTYVLGWFSGLIFFFFEKNRTVRWHAAQSIVTFGTLSILLFVINLLRGFLGLIPILNIFTGFALGLLLYILGWVIGILWIGLIILVALNPNFRLPFFSNWADKLV